MKPCTTCSGYAHFNVVKLMDGTQIYFSRIFFHLNVCVFMSTVKLLSSFSVESSKTCLFFAEKDFNPCLTFHMPGLTLVV